MTNHLDDELKHGKWRMHPALREGGDAALFEKRHVISSLFIAMLLGIAYQEMLSPVRDEIRAHGISLGIVLFPLTFFFASMRFSIGNQLHLMSDGVKSLRGDVWLFDFLVIVGETVLFGFLGGVSAPAINRQIPITFYHLFVAICLLDVVWVVSQWLLGMIVPGWKRAFIPWSWCMLNALMSGAAIVLFYTLRDPFGDTGAMIIFAVNLVAFVADMILIDYHDMI